MVTDTPGPATTPATAVRTFRLPLYIRKRPTNRQLAFLMLEEEEAFFGGAGGGGKTMALLMAALQYAHLPGYAAVIFRKTYPQLTMQGGLIERSHELLAGTDAEWREGTKRWSFPGGTLDFRTMDTGNSHREYGGLEAQFIGFDELTAFNEAQYRFLFSRLRRRDGLNVPLRMRATSNPGDIGHEWVKQRFITEGPLAGRPFVRSKIADNPHLDRASYIKTLENLDPVTRAQILEGDWSARPIGGIFRREWFGVPVEAVPTGLSMVRAWDFAGTEAKQGGDPDWTVGVKLGKTPQGVYYVLDVRRLRATAFEVERAVQQCAAIDGRGCRIEIEQEGGSSGKDVAARYIRLLSGYRVRATRPTGDKVTRAGPFASQVEAGNVKLVSGPWIGAYLDELDSFPNGAHDDQVDASSLASNTLAIRIGLRVSTI